ncbi:MAG: hypothetical protein AAGC68_05775 [Verrucomicrobiota bacterium]
MSELRFEIGTAVMCNLGPNGWKLGQIIAQHYREDHWPAEQVAPYQVLLENDEMLIYVPEDDDRYCRAAANEELRMARRPDALAALPVDPKVTGSETVPKPNRMGSAEPQLRCDGVPTEPGTAGYRGGRCYCCESCPRSWSAVELYSEHYRCAERNGLAVTRRHVDLGTVCIGESVHYAPSDILPCHEGFLQCPMLVRLPPGLRFSDDGTLTGKVQFDPHRKADYRVDFVAVSTASWNDEEVGIVRLEITFLVEGNEPPVGFDLKAFQREQEQASEKALGILRDIGDTWERWELGELDNSDTCDEMLVNLGRLRELCESHPRLDRGRYWAHLGGYHMNVHKLLENALFECELYLGYALTVEDAGVRHYAEANLEGCYQKRLIESARFLWIDGVQQMMRGEWATAASTLQNATAQKDGWGWAVNFGDIWFTESAARLVHGAELLARSKINKRKEGAQWIAEATRLLELGEERTEEAQFFGPEGHPWAVEIGEALATFQSLLDRGASSADWLAAFQERTTYWCAHILSGTAPFPPKPRPRREDAVDLVRRLPDHNK